MYFFFWVVRSHHFILVARISFPSHGIVVDAFVGKFLGYISNLWYKIVQPYIEDVGKALQEIPAGNLAMLRGMADSLRELTASPLMNSRDWVKDSAYVCQFLVYARDTIECIKLLKLFNVAPLILTLEQAQFLYNHVHGNILFNNINAETVTKLVNFQKAAIADGRSTQLADVLAKDGPCTGRVTIAPMCPKK